jgi:hypothetical protein
VEEVKRSGINLRHLMKVPPDVDPLCIPHARLASRGRLHIARLTAEFLVPLQTLGPNGKFLGAFSLNDNKKLSLALSPRLVMREAKAVCDRYERT